MTNRLLRKLAKANEAGRALAAIAERPQFIDPEDVYNEVEDSTSDWIMYGLPAAVGLLSAGLVANSSGGSDTGKAIGSGIAGVGGYAASRGILHAINRVRAHYRRKEYVNESIRRFNEMNSIASK